MGPIADSLVLANMRSEPAGRESRGFESGA
jgi:hypothetical protein